MHRFTKTGAGRTFRASTLSQKKGRPLRRSPPLDDIDGQVGMNTIFIYLMAPSAEV
eukprot:COSAG06_NODE_19796_length_822_cov_1.128631_3_plen_55_part_01